MTSASLLLEPVAGKPLGAADYARLARQIASAGPLPNLRPLRLGILSSSTMQFAEPSLVVEAARRRVQLSAWFGPFGQFEQQVAEGSALHAFHPQAVLLFMRPEDLDPDFGVRYYAGAERSRVLRSAVDRLIECITVLRRHSTAPVLVANFAVPAHLPLGPFDASVEQSLTYTIAEANQLLRARLAELPETFIWDYAGLVREAGSTEWSDPRLWAIGRIPVASRHQPVLARHLARSLAGLVFTPAKCLVLDLDNTLWGGVIGDDGLQGIHLGDDYPGSVFKSFQRAVLGLSDRGILLAAVSKNYPEVVEQVLREHPEMLIRAEHFSAMRINWQPKSQNLREIALELNIGVDALVHFDDSPVERAEIAANAPEVRLIDVPTDPLGYQRALHECGFFDVFSISQEDTQRVEMYRTQKAREEIRSSAGTVDEFLTGLEMVAEVGRVDSANVARVAQLVGKTNQFNLTTRRHSLAEITRMCSDPDHAAVFIRLRDRFGDLGLIAVGLVRYEADQAVIDTLVMSCRAMGRQVENALVYELFSEARKRGCRLLVGEYLPTARNGIVAELYPSLGFSGRDMLGEEGKTFVMDLISSRLEWPSAIRREPQTSRAG